MTRIEPNDPNKQRLLTRECGHSSEPPRKVPGNGPVTTGGIGPEDRGRQIGSGPTIRVIGSSGEIVLPAPKGVYAALRSHAARQLQSRIRII